MAFSTEGHFAAMEEPELLVQDLRQIFQPRWLAAQEKPDTEISAECIHANSAFSGVTSVVGQG
jgi:hypothetical protein